MHGYVVHHQSELYEGVRADRYRNDPYVWHDPFLWSFCHVNQPRPEPGMTILWVSKDEQRQIVCDLVFVVEEILNFGDAVERFAPHDCRLALDHFIHGVLAHLAALRPEAKTYVADMKRSYIPHPEVKIGCDIDRILGQQRPGAKSVDTVFRRPSPPLRISDMSELERIVSTKAKQRIEGALPITNDYGSQPTRRWTRHGHACRRAA